MGPDGATAIQVHVGGLSSDDAISDRRPRSPKCDAMQIPTIVLQQLESEKQIVDSYGMDPAMWNFPTPPNTHQPLSVASPPSPCASGHVDVKVSALDVVYVLFQIGNNSAITNVDAFSVLRCEKPTIVNCLSVFML